MHAITGGSIRADLFDAAFLRRVEHLAVLARRIASSGQRAQRRSKKIGSGIEFADHRAYTEGDDPRHLDWKVYARSERLLLRRYEEEQDLTVHLLVDCSPSMSMAREGQRTPHERALQVAAALGYVSLCNLDRVSVVPFSGGKTAPSRAVRGKSQYATVLRQLSSLQLGGATHLRAALRDLPRFKPRKGIVVVLSDLCDADGLGDALRYLTLHGHECLVLQLSDIHAFESQIWGDLTLVDVETNERREVTLTPALLRAYQLEYEALTEAAQAMCRDVGARHLRADIALPFDTLVMRVFREGGFLG